MSLQANFPILSEKEFCDVLLSNREYCRSLLEIEDNKKIKELEQHKEKSKVALVKIANKNKKLEKKFQDHMNDMERGQNMVNKAICITLGEQSENHVGMIKYGNGLSEIGYSVGELEGMKLKFEEKGCVCELIVLNDLLKDEECEEKACVLVIRNCIDVILGEGKSKEMMKEMANLEWDNKYWDTRRSKVLNKRARFNLCFGDESKESDLENGIGTVVGFDKAEMLGKVKKEIEEICGEKRLECEGNFYYDAKKCGIGFHGDGERKKVVGISLCSSDVVREINWIWYKKSQRVSERQRVKLYNGDCYVMSEKSSGFDWKRKNILTLRHAAGVEGNNYLK